jgi:UBX domain-containing protein 1
VFLTVLF